MDKLLATDWADEKEEPGKPGKPKDPAEEEAELLDNLGISFDTL